MWNSKADGVRDTCILLTLGFLIAGLSHWFSHYYSYNMAYLSENLLWVLIAMALFHHNQVSLSNHKMFEKNNLIFWILPAVTFLTWEIIGKDRLDGKWLRFSYNVSWSFILAFATILAIV